MDQEDGRLVRRRETRRTRRPAWWRRYRFELIGLAALVAGVVLILGRGTIRLRLAGFLTATLQTLSGRLARLDSALGIFLSKITVSDVIGVALIFAALALILWRLRERILHDPAFTTIACPRCGGVLHRVHRHRLDHMVDKVVPVRRYRCGDDACKWQGLRVGRTQHGSASKRATSSR